MADNSSDLDLAQACARAEPQAVAEFERRYGVEIDRGVAKLGSDEAARDELRQIICERLFVGDSPKIATYNGLGDLQHWVRVVVARARADFARGAGRRAARASVVADPALGVASPADDPEFAHLKAHYGNKLAQAIEAAMTALSERDRELLRNSAIEGMTSDAIGERHGVSGATARRWIAAAREAVLEGTRLEIAERLGVGEQEFASIVRLARSEVDLSIPRILGARSEPGKS